MTRKSTAHGHTAGGKNSPTYRSWTCMRERCTDPKHPSFRWYGAEGITVDPAWDDFGTFLADMGERPEGMTLDRIDNSAGYTPGNCRWATKADQSRNRRSTRWVTIEFLTLTVAEWCTVFGTSERAVRGRLERGWTMADAVSLPPEPPGRKPASCVRAPKPAPSVDRRGNRRPRPRMTAKEYRAHQAARLATRIAERKGIEVTW